jgi:hypothetical protein
MTTHHSASNTRRVIRGTRSRKKRKNPACWNQHSRGWLPGTTQQPGHSTNHDYFGSYSFLVETTRKREQYMNDTIRVRVVEFSDRKTYQLQWTDPMTER